ncbi:hypothetical protein CDAR_553221 [Caerostris darwini]|uniref:Secreted protein n=1 Tax=Caerostris darwini TaxID=1538125 RepID=A0AAV4X2R3_9ARAC|nr:hypothetical protein CDAR_553221 [Caerostris darwini]
MPLTLFASVTLSVALVLSSDRRPLQHRRVIIEKQFDSYLYFEQKRTQPQIQKQTILKRSTVEEQKNNLKQRARTNPTRIPLKMPTRGHTQHY